MNANIIIPAGFLNRVQNLNPNANPAVNQQQQPNVPAAICPTNNVTQNQNILTSKPAEPDQTTINKSTSTIFIHPPPPTKRSSGKQTKPAVKRPRAALYPKPITTKSKVTKNPPPLRPLPPLVPSDGTNPPTRIIPHLVNPPFYTFAQSLSHTNNISTLLQPLPFINNQQIQSSITQNSMLVPLPPLEVSSCDVGVKQNLHQPKCTVKMWEWRLNIRRHLLSESTSATSLLYPWSEDHKSYKESVQELQKIGGPESCKCNCGAKFE